MNNKLELHKLIDELRAKDSILELVAIPGKSREENSVQEYLHGRIRAAGVVEKSILRDSAHKKSGTGGEVGNLIVKLPGTIRGPRRLLMSHTDTVPLCVGCKPVVEGDRIVTKGRVTALGGDDRAGVSVLLTVLETILNNKLPHPPLTFLWTVQEEIGLVGARHVSVSKLGNPKLCFNWDGRSPYAVIIGATGDDAIEIEVTGIASHAGAHPEHGVSAIAIASLAIANLQNNGWHGLIEKGDLHGTSNIGLINGGAATNVVTDCVTLKAEARSHSKSFRRRIVKEMINAFESAAKQIKNVHGETGSVDIKVANKYEAFKISSREPVVKAACKAIEMLGETPDMQVINGGLDANWMSAHGLPTVTMGCGQDAIHTVDETLHLPSYLDACRIALTLATASEG